MSATQPADTSATPIDEPARGQAARAYIAAGMGWGLDGFTWTIYGFALTAAIPALGIASGMVGWITALSILASAIGGAMGGTLADRFGRTRVLTWVIVGYSVFTALTATSQNTGQFLFWRILEGLAFGAEWAVGAALVAEYASARSRGRVLAAVQSCYAIGWAASTAAYLAIFSVVDDGTAWRVLFLIGVTPALAVFWIRLGVKDRVNVTSTATRRLSIAELFTKRLRRSTCFATLLGLGVQGIYYSVFVFLPLFLKEERGLSVVGTATYTWVVITGSFLGYYLSGHVHDAIGRRPTFTLFFLGSVASTALFVNTGDLSTSMGYPICFLLGFFASGQAGGLGAFLAEQFPTNVRGAGQGFAYNVGRGIAGFGPLSIGHLTDSTGLGNAILLVCCCAATIGLIAVWSLPETRNSEIIHPEIPPTTKPTTTATTKAAERKP